MPNIQKLPVHEAQKIAAGEVVERPANIVKELIENALDAGATQITIHVQQAGKKSIRIQDNGYGMDKDDAQRCFEHHATSKIKQVEDLHSINTFGFRGEALSSIASVSRITLITKQQRASEGTKVVIENGIIMQESAVPATTGTDITIEHLFDAMPARKKFLKSKETEWRHVQQLFSAFALDYTQISFKLYSENRLLFNCVAVDTLAGRWQQLVDQEASSYLITLHTPTTYDAFTVTGVISSQQYGRYDRNGIYIFVNNRWIKDYKLNRALINGYQNALPTHQFPIACIKIDIDPTWIDVNIHPRKEEVQFLHPHKIYQAIKQAVQYTLEEHVAKLFGDKPSSTGASQPIKYEAARSAKKVAPSVPLDLDMLFEEPFDISSAVTKDTQSVAPIHMPVVKKQEQSIQVSEKVDCIPMLDADSHGTQRAPYTIIGTFNKTYILLEQESQLVMIDQHAAHERVLYEAFKSARTPVTVQLLFPQIIRYSQEVITLLTPHLSMLHTYGIEAELFSETQVVIKAIPVQLKNASLEDILDTCIATLHQEKNSSQERITEQFSKTLHADIACKAAIKAGDMLAEEQIVQLIADIKRAQNRFSCPHGRPTMWHIPLDTIKKKFKRDYR